MPVTPADNIALRESLREEMGIVRTMPPSMQRAQTLAKLAMTIAHLQAIEIQHAALVGERPNLPDAPTSNVPIIKRTVKQITLK